MALPLVLVMLAALLVLVLALVAMTHEGQRADRAWLEHVRSEFAVDAGFHEVVAKMRSSMANDDYLIVRSVDGDLSPDGYRRVPLLYVDRPHLEDGRVFYRREALFSAEACLSDVACAEWSRSIKDRPGCRDGEARFRVGSGGDRAEVDWSILRDEKGRCVARYAYWIEDLQARLDPRWVGNRRGDGGGHQRVAFPFPASGVDDPRIGDDEPMMNQIALEALVPLEAGEDGLLAMQRLLEARERLDSPESFLWHAGKQAPLPRRLVATPGLAVGDLVDPMARRMEEALVVGLRSYDEQVRVPYGDGIEVECMGEPKLDLNRLLRGDRSSSIDEMALWIERALPKFATRAGGFSSDYLRTLAANALDYADADDLPGVGSRGVRGVDSHPWVSEVVLHVHYQGLVREEDRWVMKWRFRLFVELWNMSNVPIAGGLARVSYEVNLKPTPVGIGGGERAFDDVDLLDDRRQSRHDLERIDGCHYGPQFEVRLRPDEYRFYEVAAVEYTLDCQPQFDARGKPVVEWFDLSEAEEGMRGLSLCWNGKPVQRLPRMVRDPFGLSDFRTDQSRKASKACIPGLNYGLGVEFANNMGDPRMAEHFRNLPLGENASPENVSPHRRNVRRRNIYDRDPSPVKSRHYGRVLPSQWPDGGHDSDTGDFLVTTSDAAVPTDPVKWPLSEVPSPLVANAPMRISNAGRFFSVVEWGRVYDPVMWRPAYPDLRGLVGSGEEDTRRLNGMEKGYLRPEFPVRRVAWPEVTRSSVPSFDHGGGNTLRVGRPEHQRFQRPGLQAVRLLDLFHAGDGGPVLQRIEGQVNVNTARREVLRCLVWGALRQDPGLVRVVDRNHDLSGPLHERVSPWVMDEDEIRAAADRVADAIVRHRPFSSVSQLAEVTDRAGVAVFGVAGLAAESEGIRCSDAAAEEMFGRLHGSSTLRSRNFRVWVVAQVPESADRPDVVRAEMRRVFTVFADPGRRRADGSLDPEQMRIRLLHERDF